MQTNESINPENAGTGSGANYGTGASGTGYSASNPSTTNTTSSGNLGNSSTGDSSASGTSSYGTTSGDNNPHHDYSATQKGAEIAGGAGAVVGRGIDAVQNTAGDAARAVTGNDTNYGTTTYGTFKDRSSAERAYNSLASRGYTKDDVNVLMSDDTRKTHFGDNTPETDLGDKAMEGAGVGSAIGGTAGAIIGAIAAIGTSVALPGLGLVIAGPIAAALAGAGAGGLTGGLVGALVGSGIPEEHAAEYESDVKNGGIVMGVKHRNPEDAQYLHDEFTNSSADKVRSY